MEYILGESSIIKIALTSESIMSFNALILSSIYLIIAVNTLASPDQIKILFIDYRVIFFGGICWISDSSKANINIKAYGKNEHHKIESIFKAFAKSVKSAVKMDKSNMILPTTKGII